MKRNDPRKPKPGSGETLQLTSEKPIYGGNCLARHEGKAIFVPLTLPGEEVRGRIIEEKRSYATAEPEAILSASPNRTEPGCRHFGVCGGCQYQHADYEAQLGFKQTILRETFERGGVHAPDRIDVLAGDPWRYRNRIRLAVDSAGRVGYRARRSHSIVPIGECPIAAPVLVTAAINAVETWRVSNPNQPLAEISLFTNADESKLLLTLLTQNLTKKSIDQFSESIKKRVPALKGVQLVYLDRSGQSAETLAAWGDPFLSYGVNGVDYNVGHGAFFQVNRWLLDDFVDLVTRGKRGSNAWDLFAGVGLFARRLAASFAEVTAVESSPLSTRTLDKNLEGTTGRAMKSDVATFLTSKAARSKPDLIVVDPPRTGLGSEITSLLSNVNARIITYVSCDPATLARDLHMLITAGYAVSSVTLADLFPQTFHLETVVELQRS